MSQDKLKSMLYKHFIDCNADSIQKANLDNSTMWIYFIDKVYPILTTVVDTTPNLLYLDYDKYGHKSSKIKAIEDVFSTIDMTPATIRSHCEARAITKRSNTTDKLEVELTLKGLYENEVIEYLDMNSLFNMMDKIKDELTRNHFKFEKSKMYLYYDGKQEPASVQYSTLEEAYEEDLYGLMNEVVSFILAMLYRYTKKQGAGRRETEKKAFHVDNEKNNENKVTWSYCLDTMKPLIAHKVESDTIRLKFNYLMKQITKEELLHKKYYGNLNIYSVFVAMLGFLKANEDFQKTGFTKIVKFKAYLETSNDIIYKYELSRIVKDKYRVLVSFDNEAEIGIANIFSAINFKLVPSTEGFISNLFILFKRFEYMYNNFLEIRNIVDKTTIFRYNYKSTIALQNEDRDFEQVVENVDQLIDIASHLPRELVQGIPQQELLMLYKGEQVSLSFIQNISIGNPLQISRDALSLHRKLPPVETVDTSLYGIKDPLTTLKRVQDPAINTVREITKVYDKVNMQFYMRKVKFLECVAEQIAMLDRECGQGNLINALSILEGTSIEKTNEIIATDIYPVNLVVSYPNGIPVVYPKEYVQSVFNVTVDYDSKYIQNIYMDPLQDSFVITKLGDLILFSSTKQENGHILYFRATGKEMSCEVLRIRYIN